MIWAEPKNVQMLPKFGRTMARTRETRLSQMDMINNRLCEHWTGHSFFIQYAFVFHLEAINIIFESCGKVERHQLTRILWQWCFDVIVPKAPGFAQ